MQDWTVYNNCSRHGISTIIPVKFIPIRSRGVFVVFFFVESKIIFDEFLLEPRFIPTEISALEDK